MSELGDYYDRLARLLRLTRRVGHGGGVEHLTVHRFLAPPGSAEPARPDRIHDLLADALMLQPGQHVLDAGCGLGGTLRDLARRQSITGEGRTISASQAATARAALAEADLAGRILIQQASYDAPYDQAFDAIWMIESLAHSPDPVATLAHLARQLRPGGRIAIVDDHPEGAEDADLAWFRRGWQVPHPLSPAALATAVTAAGLRITSQQDLSAWQRLKSPLRAGVLLSLCRLARPVTPASWRSVLDGYAGGLALERRYGRDRMRYLLTVAER
ncbi:MAG: methyltransferase domain-containing protein [Alphaproteobacteria bacterium]|nr:methyltransferase domain-containing protein [Alphaproteobacteria bacterium]